MALNMVNATYGRGQENTDRLRNLIDNEMMNYMLLLRGPKYQELVDTIKRYWSGEDADKFLAVLDKRVGDMQHKIVNVYRGQINQAILEDYHNFLRMQSTNKNIIG